MSSKVRLLFDGDQTLAAADALATWTGASGPAWADRVVGALTPGTRALGVLAFAPGGPAVMHQVAGTTAMPAYPADSFAAHEHTVTEHPSVEEYADRVRRALKRIAEGRLHKVVLGRCLDIVSDPPLEPGDVLGRLLVTRPGRYLFTVPLTADLTGGPTLLGASPELLVRRRGAEVSSLPLAGSAPRSADPATDARRAEELLVSGKDHDEHAFVVEQILATLGRHALEIEADPAPGLVATDTMWHLGTPIRARLAAGSGPSALHLAQLLHPTPAVGGVPTEAALATIDEYEGADLRGVLAGAVGWVDGAGDGEFAVAIRAGVLHGERLRLFAGAGIVAGSDPDAETRETSAKLATMARVVGL